MTYDLYQGTVDLFPVAEFLQSEINKAVQEKNMDKVMEIMPYLISLRDHLSAWEVEEPEDGAAEDLIVASDWEEDDEGEKTLAFYFGGFPIKVSPEQLKVMVDAGHHFLNKQEGLV